METALIRSCRVCTISFGKISAKSQAMVSRHYPYRRRDLYYLSLGTCLMVKVYIRDNRNYQLQSCDRHGNTDETSETYLRVRKHLTWIQAQFNPKSETNKDIKILPVTKETAEPAENYCAGRQDPSQMEYHMTQRVMRKKIWSWVLQGLKLRMTAGKGQQQFTQLTKETAPLSQTFKATLQTWWSMT